MNSVAAIFGFQIAVSFVEILIFQIGAIILGFSIHFFWTSRKTQPANGERPVLAGSSLNPGNEWRLKYVEETEARQKFEKQIRKELEMTRDNESILVIELEEAKKEIDKLEEQIRLSAKTEEQPQAETYLAQLHVAHNHLHEHNQSITKLLEQIDMLKESEKKHISTQQVNEELHATIHELRRNLFDKENEIRMVRQQQHLTQEIHERLNKAYTDYNSIQDNISRLKTYIAKPENRNFEYEDLQQSFFRLTNEFDGVKLKQHAMLEENQR
ncbi:MAG: hypothetical protein EOO00_07210, partial [Chitinophagaceae bacterium]